VTLLALAVREPAEHEGVGACEQAHPIVKRQPLAGVEFFGDIAKSKRGNPREHVLLV
jgi:hypothetical protein